MAGAIRRRTRGTVLAAAVLVAGVTAMAALAAAFTIVESPNPGDSNSIDGLVSFGPSEVWAIGNSSKSDYAGCHGRTLTTRWNGSGFVEVQDPGTPVCA